VHIDGGGRRVLTSERAISMMTGVIRSVPTSCPPTASHLICCVHTQASPDVVPAYPLLCMASYMRAGIYSRLAHRYVCAGEEKDNEGDSRGCEFFG
jgi:hypothetical protein